MLRRTAGLVAVLAGLAACSSSATGAASTEVASTTSTANGAAEVAPTTPVSVPTTSVPVTTTAAATTTSTTAESTTTVASNAVGVAGDVLGEVTIGTSFDGRPITAWHRGAAGGKVILVVGVIHGDENDGLKIVDQLATMPLPPGIDLWLLPALNPDGVAHDWRGNGNGVDLNRNFPHDWTAISHRGDWQWSGPGPASEPETKAYMAFAERIRPVLTLWFHQDLFRVSPSKGRDAPLRRTYAELTGLKYETISGPTSIYTGVAATWTRTQVPEAMSFVIELGSTLSAVEAKVHAAAVLTIAQMA
jgi:protein MpaA